MGLFFNKVVLPKQGTYSTGKGQAAA